MKPLMNLEPLPLDTDQQQPTVAANDDDQTETGSMKNNTNSQFFGIDDTSPLTAETSDPSLKQAELPESTQSTTAALHLVPIHQMVFNFGLNRQDVNPRQAEMSIRDLAERFRIPYTDRGTLPLAEYLSLDKAIPEEKAVRDGEKDGEYFIPVEFTHVRTRNAADVKSISGFTGDIDTGNISKSILEMKLNGLQYIAYSSYSHCPSNPRWRFFIPYAKPTTPAEHEKAFSHFQKLFEGQLDERCKTTNQIWYTPACPKDALPHFESWMSTGDMFDPKKVSEVATAVVTERPQVLEPVTPPRSLSLPDLDRLNSALQSISSNNRQDWIKVGIALHRGVGRDTGLNLWLNWSKKSDKFDHADALATWKAFDADKGNAHLTLGTVFHLAKEKGWISTLSAMPNSLSELNETHFVAIDGGKTWVFREAVDPELHRSYLERIAPTGFKDFYSNQTVSVQRGDVTKKINKAVAWLDHPGRRSYDAISFLPGRSAPAGTYNLWSGFAVVPQVGDWSLMQQHISEVICNNQSEYVEYLLNWMAFAVQHPDKPAEVAVVLQGGRGTGKGKLANMFGALFGQHKLQITQVRHLTGNFNSHLRTCIFLFVDEALWAGDKTGENVLKGLITESTLTIEGKGQNVITAPNRLHIMMASNNDWVVPAGAAERRFFVLNVADKYAQIHAYFAAIDEQMLKQDGLAAMMHDLMQRDLTKFNIRSVPRTAGLEDQILLTLDPSTKWWMDHLGQTFSPNGWKFQSRSKLQEKFATAFGANSYLKGSQTQLGMFLRNVVPGGRASKVSRATHPGHFEQCYEFPDQEACKKYLMSKLTLQTDPWL